MLLSLGSHWKGFFFCIQTWLTTSFEYTSFPGKQARKKLAIYDVETKALFLKIPIVEILVQMLCTRVEIDITWGKRQLKKRQDGGSEVDLKELFKGFLFLPRWTQKRRAVRNYRNKGWFMLAASDFVFFIRFHQSRNCATLKWNNSQRIALLNRWISHANINLYNSLEREIADWHCSWRACGERIQSSEWKMKLAITLNEICSKLVES